jgi:DNA-binding MarR family transcriptional regulator
MAPGAFPSGAIAVAHPAIFGHLSPAPDGLPAAWAGNDRRMANTGPIRDSTLQSGSAPAGEPLLKLEDFLPHRLNVLSSLVSQALTRVYGRYGIGIPEWRVLVTLGENGVMTGKAVGRHTHMHKTKVSRAVAQLEGRKLVVRKANRADLRESFLSLTPAGRAIYQELAPRALEFTMRLAEVVTPVDRAAFDRAMTHLTERSAELVAELEPTAADAED